MARPLAVSTPLGPDALLLTSFSGTEAISQLFSFQLELQASNDQPVPFERLLGQPFTVDLSQPGRQDRFFSGICASFGEGARSAASTAYRAEVVPALWLLTKRHQSRIFQQMSVPDVLRQVLAELDVSYQLQGSYEPRNYCVQYRETDFDFASRLMEEEGIYYFFTHAADGHRLVLADTPQGSPDLPDQSTVHFDLSPPHKPGTLSVYEWVKTQSLSSGKVTLRDHNFELPQASLEAVAAIQESAVVGQVTHALHVAGNDRLELYDYPGEYAKRFDGIDPGGGERPDELAKILPDAQRTAGIRMQEEAAQGLEIDGASTASNFVSGYRFALDGHPDANGQYVLTSVQHTASVTGGGQGQQLSYSNRFTCIPVAVPFRPPRKTPKAMVEGLQTAVVVGPAGSEIFTDKYGRVKVQFFWDRQGKKDEKSSCWIRVSQLGQSSSVFIPRIGQEVIVAFEEGDPDRPIVLGAVYNADHLPPPQPPPPQP